MRVVTAYNGSITSDRFPNLFPKKITKLQPIAATVEKQNDLRQLVHVVCSLRFSILKNNMHRAIIY